MAAGVAADVTANAVVSAAVGEVGEAVVDNTAARGTLLAVNAAASGAAVAFGGAAAAAVGMDDAASSWGASLVQSVFRLGSTI